MRTAQPPVIDGALTDEAWSQAEPASDFTQRDPNEGMPATEHTEIRILYDDEALYIAARMFDSQPALIARRLSTRDADADADRVSIYLDGMHDHLTGAAFEVSASNIQKDATSFKELAQPRTFDFLEYSERRVAFDAPSRIYTIDPDGDDPAQSFSFDDPDFNVKSLRMNAVFRWELKPGSTFYAVWTRHQRDESHPGRFAAGRDARAMLSAPADDVVLVKVAYWIGR